MINGMKSPRVKGQDRGTRVIFQDKMLMKPVGSYTISQCIYRKRRILKKGFVIWQIRR